MEFEAYYDSSGTRGDRAATTLAGVAAPKDAWRKLEPVWQNALDENGVPDRRFSMADLMSSHGRFKGWDGQRQHRLLTALFNVLATFRPMGMSGYSCTVFFHAYDIAKAQVPKLRNLEDLCVNHCVGGLQLKAERSENEQIKLYLFFDRNERFLNSVNQVWLKSKKKKKGWPDQVQDIQVADDSRYGIQAADLLAWIVNRRRCEAFERGEPQPTAHLSFTEELDRQMYLFFHGWSMVDHHMKVYDDPSKILADYGAGRKRGA